MSLRWNIAQWCERHWWQWYLCGKNKETYYRLKKLYWQRLLDQMADVLPIAKDATIADLGCGPAGIFILFDQRKVLAADPLLDSYEKALPFFDKKDYPHTTFLTQALEDFQSEEQYDVVFCMNAINHVADISLAYDRLMNTVKPDGDIVVSIDAHNHPFFKALFQLIPGDILHPHQYDLDEYKAFMTDRGCTITKEILVKKEFFFSHYMLVGTMNTQIKKRIN